MDGDKVLQFPCPDHGLSGEELACEVTKLAGDLASALSEQDGYDRGLPRIEKASILLHNISLLVSRGRGRQRATEAFERVMLSIAELRANLRKDA